MKKTFAVLFAVLFVLGTLVVLGGNRIYVAGVDESDDFVSTYSNDSTLTYVSASPTSSQYTYKDTVGGYEITDSDIYLSMTKKVYTEWLNGTSDALFRLLTQVIGSIYDDENVENMREFLKEMPIYGLALNGAKLGVNYPEAKLEINHYVGRAYIDVGTTYYDWSGRCIRCTFYYYMPNYEYYSDMENGIVELFEKCGTNMKKREVITQTIIVNGEEVELDIIHKKNTGFYSLLLDHCVVTLSVDDNDGFTDELRQGTQQLVFYDFFAEETPIAKKTDYEVSAEQSQEDISDTSDDITSSYTSTDDSTESLDSADSENGGNNGIYKTIIIIDAVLAACAVVLLIIFKPKKKEE